MLSRKLMVAGAVAMALGWVSRPAMAQVGRGTTGSVGSQGFGLSPYTNPYLNPYANPYLYNAPSGGVGAAMVFMSSQQAMAQAAQQRAEIAQGRETRRVPSRSSMNVPGGGAARYFGGASGPADRDDARFQRQSRYFRPNG